MDLEKIGKFIADRRKEKGLTQVQLADKLNVSDKAISKWERGICLMDMILLEPLSKELDVSINELLAGEVIIKADKKILNESTISGIKSYQKRTKRKTTIFLTILYFLILIPCVTYVLIVLLAVKSQRYDDYMIGNKFYKALKEKDLETIKYLVSDPFYNDSLNVPDINNGWTTTISVDEFVNRIEEFYDSGGEFTSFGLSGIESLFNPHRTDRELCAKQNEKEGCIGMTIWNYHDRVYFTFGAIWDSNDEKNLTPTLVKIFEVHKDINEKEAE